MTTNYKDMNLLTPPDPKPNCDEAICENCEIIIDELGIIKTEEGDSGCTECIENCKWCGNSHFGQDMYSSPYFGKICKDCIKDYGYKRVVKTRVTKEALRCYFDETKDKRIELDIVQVTQLLGFNDLAKEMRNDLAKEMRNHL